VAEHRDKSQLAGDCLREMAVLIIVFYTLDTSLAGTFDWWNFVLVAVLASTLLGLGMILEGTEEL
jgi:hypothetical protein